MRRRREGVRVRVRAEEVGKGLLAVGGEGGRMRMGEEVGCDGGRGEGE